VDPFDFLWDPLGDSMDNVEFVIHRLWRGPAAVKRNVANGTWRSAENDETCPWTLEDLLSSRARTQRSDVWDQRLTAEGYNTESQRQDALHEVWEFHDGNQVITVLDAAYPVQAGANPGGVSQDAVSDLPPDRRRRPVRRHLRDRADQAPPVRDQHAPKPAPRRRDLSLMRTFAYNETAVDPDDLVFGPNMAIPVNGDPRDFLFPIPVPELPASSYREEDAIINDIQRTSGISDPVTGGDVGASETATGVQLVQQAAGMRIQNKARLLENSVIVAQGYEFIALNQRRILATRMVPVPQEPDPFTPNIPAWKMVPVGPRELMGRMAIEVEGGSTAPENVPQQRQDAQMWIQLSADQRVNGEKALIRAFELMGSDQPEGYLRQPQPMVPAEQIQGFLSQLGVPPELFAQFLEAQAAQQQQQAQQGAQQQGAARAGRRSRR
jgi:hypothetical protein